MTEKEFFTELRKLKGKDWHYIKSPLYGDPDKSYGGVIRQTVGKRKQCCPITAVAKNMGKGFFTIGKVGQGSIKLGLDASFTCAIVDAADNKRTKLRRKIERAVGLRS